MCEDPLAKLRFFSSLAFVSGLRTYYVMTVDETPLEKPRFFSPHPAEGVEKRFFSPMGSNGGSR